MKIDYSRLFVKLREEKITQKEFKEKAKISSATLLKMLHNENITTGTICKICDFFQCMPNEIMEWIPESSAAERQAEKENLQHQIAKLQEKLKNI